MRRALAGAARLGLNSSVVAGEPADGFTVLERSAPLSPAVSFGQAAERIMSWEMHRRAGLRIEATAPRVAVGVEVVQAVRMGPVWVLAPCRVTEVIEQPDRIGFTYAALHGHPELGAEQFVVDRSGFTVRATSRSAYRDPVLPRIASLVQDRAIDRYIRAVVS